MRSDCEIEVIVIIGAISLWVFFSEKSDFRWANFFVEQEMTKGWNLVYKQDNFVGMPSFGEGTNITIERQECVIEPALNLEGL